MSNLEEEVNELKKEYEEKFKIGLDPFMCFFAYEPGSDLKEEKKWLVKSLKEGIPIPKYKKAGDYFCEKIVRLSE